MNNLYFNNYDFIKDLDCYMLKGYSYPVVSEEIEDIVIEGNSFGTLTQKTDNYSDLKFQVNLRMVKIKDYNDKISIIEEAINNIEDNRLYFKDKLEKCLKVKRVVSDSYTKENEFSIKFQLTFICEPFWYDTDIEEIELSNESSFISPTHINYEVFAECEANGNTRIFINDELLQFNHTGKVIIDCERGYVYTTDKTLVKTTGNDKLVIHKGINKYMSDTNTTIKIKLKNRYKR